MGVGDGQMQMVVFFNYFTCGDEMTPLYWAGRSDLYSHLGLRETEIRCATRLRIQMCSSVPPLCCLWPMQFAGFYEAQP